MNFSVLVWQKKIKQINLIINITDLKNFGKFWKLRFMNKPWFVPEARLNNLFG